MKEPDFRCCHLLLDESRQILLLRMMWRTGEDDRVNL